MHSHRQDGRPRGLDCHDTLPFVFGELSLLTQPGNLVQLLFLAGVAIFLAVVHPLDHLVHLLKHLSSVRVAGVHSTDVPPAFPACLPDSKLLVPWPADELVLGHSHVGIVIFLLHH